MIVLYKFICYLTYYSGLAWLITTMVSRRKVTIILYHDPDPKTFARHIKILKRRYNVISLSILLESIQSGERTYPDHSLVITFDDGHRRNAELFDVIASERLPITIYACSSIVNTTRKYWFKLIGLDSKSVKKLSNEERLQYLSDNFDFFSEKEYTDSAREALRLNEMKTMQSWVDFQSHTCFHPILTTAADDVADSEIRKSKEELESMLATPVVDFAYPNGDYSDREVLLLKKCGYRSGRTTDVGWNDCRSNPYKLKITGVSDFADSVMLKAELSGVPAYLYNLFTGGVNKQSLAGRHIAAGRK